jgi:RNA polymerase sigma-70 factor (ECF subfamily)
MAGASPDFREQLITHVPPLRAFARALTGRIDYADDLVQETIVHALRSEKKFTPGTNLRAWLFTILRNQHVSELRNRRVSGAVPIDDLPERALVLAPDQIDSYQLRELKAALARLQPNRRAVVVMVGAFGCTYGEVAEVFNVPVGTVKSRLSHARADIANALPDAFAKAVVPQPQEASRPRRRRRRCMSADEIASADLLPGPRA